MSHVVGDLSVDFTLSTLVDWWARKIRPNLNGPTLRRRAAELGVELVEDLKIASEGGCPKACSAFNELVVAATSAGHGGTSGVKQFAGQLLEERHRGGGSAA